MLESVICKRATRHQDPSCPVNVCTCIVNICLMAYRAWNPLRKRDEKGGEERIKSVLRKVEVNLKCYLCNSLRGSMIKFSSCNKVKVYFGSVLETWFMTNCPCGPCGGTVIMVEVGGRGGTCLMEPGVKWQRAGIPISLLGYPQGTAFVRTQFLKSLLPLIVPRA